MKATIYRGTKEIGGTLIELAAGSNRILIDAGYPLFLNSEPIADDIAKLPPKQLLKLGVLPDISGLYAWDTPTSIPVYISGGTRTLIEVSQRFKIVDSYPLNTKPFKMYDPFNIGNFLVKPYLMDHSAFDAAAFEISTEGKTVIYTGDFRGHGRKAVCLDQFIDKAAKQADVLMTEGTMLGRQNEKVLSEDELEMEVSKVTAVKDIIGDGTQPLTEFDEDLFDAMVKKVVIKSKTEFDFWFESGEVVKYTV